MTAAIAVAELAGTGWCALTEGASTVDDRRPTEATLVRAAAGGDRRAFARLVETHERSVYGLCLRLLQDGEEARDAAQETFVRAWSALATFDASLPLAPWLLRIARNHAIDVARRRLPAAQRVPLDAPASARDPVQLPDAGASPADEQLARAELASTVGVAVAALPAHYREVVHLFHVEQMSYKEIAATMDVPIGTVMTWLHRARARLRDALTAREPA